MFDLQILFFPFSLLRTPLPIFLTILFGIKNNVQAQLPDCLTEPSCQHTKAMLLTAQRQWDSLAYTKNTNARSEKFDIKHYSITLDMSAHEQQRIQGNCLIEFIPLQAGLKTLPLDLLQLQVDSVTLQGKLLSFSYNDTLLQVHFEQPLPKGYKRIIQVHYQGKPQKDALWGGFYYKDEYAYNLGVGFVANPHNYGRVWHPCFDNFQERATYTFRITTKNQQRAHCNGYLQAEYTNNNRTTRIWQQQQAIPSYLAAIAVANYTVVKQSHVGIQGVIPIRLAANAADTAALVQSFVHLKRAIDAYEYWFGPHQWHKVGYSLVPFRSGAMEHASNIAYPIFAADGSLEQESLMAHELAHSWWGNLVTCATAGDMWINEGMASYSEQLFVEHVYGKRAYQQAVREKHHSVLQDAHISEGGYRPVANVPHEYTYGSHVYDKGAGVAHNLRWYMGDSAFRKGVQTVMKKYAFKNINSGVLRDVLMEATGQNLHPFFDDWVFQGGFPHFQLVAYTYKNNKVQLEIAQQLVGRTTYCTQVPLALTFQGTQGEKQTHKVWVTGALDTVEVELPFEPVQVVLNAAQELNQARFDEVHWLQDSTKTMVPLTHNLLFWEGLEVLNLGDSAYIHLQRHPVLPYTKTTSLPYELTTVGYWSVYGDWSPAFEAEGSIRLNKSNLGNLWSKGSSLDSIVLLYRPNPNSTWQEHPNYRRSLFLKNKVLVFSFLKGDYMLAKANSSNKHLEGAQYNNRQVLTTAVKNGQISLQFELPNVQKGCLRIVDSLGQCVYAKYGKWGDGAKSHFIDLPPQKGLFFIKLLNTKGQLVFSRPVRF